ncbi:MAG TPA: ATP-binding cassette domain-containing protein [Vicinamibacterales bacterium]|nr:ATP-binding cassette domain-containing protein [Vicinamibacterales bacterium]
MADALSVDVEQQFASGVRVAAAFRVEMRAGAMVVLFGPSAAGKSTVVRAIAGLGRPDRGRLQLGDVVWFDAHAGVWVGPQHRGIGYVSQDAALFPHLTVAANVEYGLAHLPASARRQQTATLVDALGLDALRARYPRQLSGGEAQRVALARALARTPRLLLLDEPFAALDTPTRSQLRRRLRTVIERLQIPAVLVTHDRAEAIAVGDQMIVLAEGRVRQVGRVHEVFQHPADRVVARSVGMESVIPAVIESVETGLVELRVGETRLRAVDADASPSRPEVLACIRAEDVTLERAAPASASARNHLHGRIVSIEPEGPLERIIVDCGFPLVALVTRSARDEMALAEGMSIVAAIKATAIHLVARD